MSAVPITLYLDTDSERHADLEVVAQASIAWARTIKEVAGVLFPELEIRLEAVSADEGSFSLNALARSLNPKQKAALIGALTGAATWFGLETASFFYGRFLEAVFDSEEPIAEQTLTEQDLSRIRDAVERGAGRSNAEEVFRIIQNDPSIRGVGVSFVPGERPAVLIPREEFRDRAGYGTVFESALLKRTRTERIEGVLIKPVLVPGSKRRWRLHSLEGEKGYVMRDADFLDRLLTGESSIPMVAGVILEVDVEIVDEFRDGVWIPGDRAILKVWGYRRAEVTGSFPFQEYDED